MSQATETRFVLPVGATLAEAVTACQQGKLEQVSLVEFCLSTPFALQDSMLLMGLVDAATFGQIMAKQTGMIQSAAKSSVQSTGQIKPAVSKKGALSIYGLNVRMPITLYVGQWERFASWAKLPEDSPLLVFIRSNPTREFDATKDYAGDDAKFLNEVKAKPSEYSSHKVAGDKVIVSLSRRS